MMIPTFEREAVLPRWSNPSAYTQGCIDEVALLSEPITVLDLVQTELNVAMIWSATTRLPDTVDNRHRQRLLGVAIIESMRFLLEYFCGRPLGGVMQLVQILASLDDDRARYKAVFNLHEGGHTRALLTPESAGRLVSYLQETKLTRPTEDDAEMLLITLIAIALDCPSNFGKTYHDRFSEAFAEAHDESFRQQLAFCVDRGIMTADRAKRDEAAVADIHKGKPHTRFSSLISAFDWLLLPRWRGEFRNEPGAMDRLLASMRNNEGLRRVTIWQDRQKQMIAHAFGAEEPTSTIRPGWAERPEWIAF